MTSYQLAWQKKRTRQSFLAAVLLHLVLVGAVLLYGLLFRENLENFSGPVLIKLGEPEGEDLPLPPQPAEETEPVQDPVQESIETPREAPVPEESPVPEEIPATLPETSKTAEQPLPQEAKDVSPVQTAAPEKVVEQPKEPEPVIIQGSDAGNAYEFQYSADTGKIGRFGDEISQYMPLPRMISAALFERLTGDSYLIGVSRQDIVKKYYSDFNGDYYFETQPPYSDVTAIWQYLIEAGYNHINADYKKDYLRPVVLEFVLSQDAELQEVRIVSSSGDIEIDRAVKEGFMNASFGNSTNRKIKGRFTYRFN